MDLKKTSQGSSETKKIGYDFSQNILKLPRRRKAVIIGLAGELGSGKTCFLQGFAKGLGIKEKILSPTFVIFKRFDIRNKQVCFHRLHLSSHRGGVFAAENKQVCFHRLHLSARRGGVFAAENKKFKSFYHFDCYRINDAKEMLLLGFEKIIFDPNNIVAIEWPEKIAKILPKNILKINFKFIDKNKREIIFHGKEINNY